eukprot:gene3653-6469_t
MNNFSNEAEDALIETLFKKTIHRLQYNYEKNKKENQQQTEPIPIPKKKENKITIESNKTINSPFIKLFKFIFKIILHPISLATVLLLFFGNKNFFQKKKKEKESNSEPFPVQMDLKTETQLNSKLNFKNSKIEFLPVEKIDMISNFKNENRKKKDIQNPFIQTIQLSTYNDMFENDDVLFEYNKVFGSKNESE